MRQNSNKKETFITACPEMGKCNKSLKLPHRSGHFCRDVAAAQRTVFYKRAPFTPFYPENIIPGFAQKRKGKV